MPPRHQTVSKSGSCWQRDTGGSCRYLMICAVRHGPRWFLLALSLKKKKSAPVTEAMRRMSQKELQWAIFLLLDLPLSAPADRNTRYTVACFPPWSQYCNMIIIMIIKPLFCEIISYCLLVNGITSYLNIFCSLNLQYMKKNTVVQTKAVICANYSSITISLLINDWLIEWLIIASCVLKETVQPKNKNT